MHNAVANTPMIAPRSVIVTRAKLFSRYVGPFCMQNKWRNLNQTPPGLSNYFETRMSS